MSRYKSKSKVLWIMAMLLLSALFLGDAFALPVAKFTLKVLDEQQVPVRRAKVILQFTEKIVKEGLTDEGGCFTAEAECNSDIYFNAEKEGYYPSNSKNGIGFKDIKKTLRGLVYREEFLPWNPIHEVVLKKVENPVPMQVKNVDGKIPVIGKLVGYDFMISDWVKPYGKGEKPDMILLYEGEARDNMNWRYKLAVQFEDKQDGLIEIIFDERKEPSYYVFPIKEAPEQGYRNKWSFIDARENGKRKREEIKEKQHFVFRVRSGTKEGPFYGKIKDKIVFGPKASGAGIRFTYYINKKRNDRSLEYNSENMRNIHSGDFEP